MNWEAGILAFILFWVPMAIIFVRFHKQDKEIDRKYEQQMKEIKEKYYGNTSKT
jgi:hypothetical protein